MNSLPTPLFRAHSGGQILGPYTPEEIRVRVRDGAFHAGVPVCRVDEDQWSPWIDVAGEFVPPAPPRVKSEPHRSAPTALDCMLSRASHDAHPSTSGAVIACAVLSLLIPGLGQFLQLRSGAAFGFFLAAFVMDLLLLPIGLIVHLLAAAECVQNAPS